jgi:signal recognition particle subunit SEC65
LTINLLYDISEKLGVDPASLLPESEGTKNPETLEEYVRLIVKDENKSILEEIKKLREEIKTKKNK